MKFRPLRVLLVMSVAFGAGCTRLPQHLSVGELDRGGLLDRQPDPNSSSPSLLTGVVTDVREQPRLLVELSDRTGDANIWLTGFKRPPARGREVWTTVLGAAQPDEFVGSAFPTSGLQPAPAAELTDQAAASLLAASAALGVIFFTGVGLLVVRLRKPRRCSKCRTRAPSDWITCPQCGTTLGPLSSEPRMSS